MNDSKSICERINRAMMDKEMSYGDVAKITKLPKSAIHRYATGQTPKVPLDRLVKIAEALGVTSAYLMGWDETHKEAEPKESPTDIALKEWLAAASEEEKQALLLLLRNFNNK